MLIFLDFDGVLHPEHDNEPTPAEDIFCHLPRFEAVMREFPMVEIVISSMWRYQFTFDQLRARFSPDIAARIIGTTPQTERIDGKYLPARREGEILGWLAATGRNDEPWIALDDAAWQFAQHRDRLVACTWHVGFDDQAAMLLRTELNSLFESCSLMQQKRARQKQDRAEVYTGIRTEESMRLFSREAIKEVQIEYRDVDYGIEGEETK